MCLLLTNSPAVRHEGPLATAHEKGDDGASPTVCSRSEDSRAIRLPTVGPGGSEVPPTVAPLAEARRRDAA
jgi:hypothetical protein